MSDFEKIGKFQVVGKLGEGSFGVVYKGHDPDLKRDVAIKVCSVEDQGLRKRFLREAEISGRLQHRNIVTVFAFGYEGDVPYLVQEHLGGEDLRLVIKRRDPLPGLRKIDILVQTAHGLAYAHSQGVIHRDIKPGNVRVLDDGSVKIMDFGIAKLATAETQLTQRGVAMGTASYLPPEQVRGGEVDHRADIFSFGILAFELLTYERPFRGNTLSALVYQILYKVPSTMVSVWPDCPPPLSEMIARCLDKKPEKRWQSLEELIPELSTLQADAATGKWPALVRSPAKTAASKKSGTEDDDDVFSQSTISRTAREVTRDRFNEATVSITKPVEDSRPKRPDPEATQVVRPEDQPTVKLKPPPPPPVPVAATVAVAASRPPEPPPPPPIPATTVALAEPPEPPPIPVASTVAVPQPATGKSTDPLLTIKAEEIGTLIAQGDLDSAIEQLEETRVRLRDGTFGDDSTGSGASRAASGSIGTRVLPDAPTRPFRAPTAERPAAPPEVPGKDATDSYMTLIRALPSWQRWAGLAAGVLVVAGIAWLVFSPAGPAPTGAPPPPPPVPTTQTTALEPLGTVLVTALPWAEITEITDAQGFVQSLPEDPYTPVRLSLAPGTYRIQLESPGHQEPNSCTVEVTADATVDCAVEIRRETALDYFKESGWWR